jgi:hypothetical protein
VAKFCKFVHLIQLLPDLAANVAYLRAGTAIAGVPGIRTAEDEPFGYNSPAIFWDV